MYNNNIFWKNQVNAIFTFVTVFLSSTEQVKVTKRSAFEKDT